MSDPFVGASYYAPAFEISIEGTSLTAEQAGIILNVSVTKQINQSDTFSFEVQDLLQNGQFKWLGNDLFKYGKKVTIKMGYPGNLTHQCEGHIQTIEPKFFTGVMPTFTVGGTHKAWGLLTEKTDSKTYLSKKNSDIVKEIAGEVGLSATVDDTGTQYEEKKKNADTSNLCFIQNMLGQSDDFEFFIDNGKLYFRKAKTDQSAVVTLKWGEHLINFNPTLDIKGLATKVIVRGWDQKNKQKIEGTASAGDEKATESGKKLGSTLAKDIFGEKEKVITRRNVETEEEANKIALAELEKANASFLTGSAETIGLPSVTPGVNVKLEGLGDWFSGTYYVGKTVHTINSEGYRTTMSLRRNVI